MDHTIGSQMITPVYPSLETRVAAITIFPCHLKAAGDQWCNVIP